MSPRALRITMIVLTTLGLAVASYLTYIHYAGIKPLCGTNGGGCEIVQTSIYSKLAGVPVALIGLIGYVVIMGSLLVPESETSRFATVSLHGRRLWLQRLSDLPRAVFDPPHLRVLRVQRCDRDDPHVPVGLAASCAATRHWGADRADSAMTPGEPTAPLGAAGP